MVMANMCEFWLRVLARVGADELSMSEPESMITILHRKKRIRRDRRKRMIKKLHANFNFGTILEPLIKRSFLGYS